MSAAAAAASAAPAETEDEVHEQPDARSQPPQVAPPPSEQLQKKQPMQQQNKKPNSKMVGGRKVLSEVLPKAGLVYSEKGNLSEVLCKPKIMPIKSITLEAIEQMDKAMAKAQ